MGFFDFFKKEEKRSLRQKQVHELIEELREGNDRQTRREAQQELVEMGAAAVYPLIGALSDTDWRVREEATRALGEIGDSRAVRHIIQLFKDEKIRVQLWATDALITMDEKAVEQLIEALHDPDRRVRMGAIVTLGEIKDLRSIVALQESLKDPDHEVVEAAKEALEAIEEGRAGLPPLTVARDRPGD